MAEIVKETVQTRRTASGPVVRRVVKSEVTTVQTIQYLIYFLFGILEILLAFRLFLKVTGANTASSFVGFIYGLTSIFIVPFEGIFRRGYAQGVETTSVLEPSVIVALIVYAVLAWGIVMLIKILSKEPDSVA